MAPRAERASEQDGGLVRAALILLPCALLAWPFPSLLADDLAPELAAAGVAALAALPAALAALLRPARARGLALLYAPLAIGALWLALGARLDTLEAERARLGALTALTLLLAGAGLGARGRAWLARGAAALAVLLVLGGLLDARRAGALGSTGDLAEAALPGALAGAVLALGAVGAGHAGAGARAAVAWRVLGAAAALGFVAWALGAPSITGVLAFAAGLAFAAVALFRVRRALALVLAGVALAPLAPLAASIERGAPRAPAAAEPPPALAAAARDPGDTGGVEVRRRVGARTLAMLLDHLWTGVGPGQFACAFPPYRDPLEIERSSLGRALGAETEVEHPHNDWLALPAELGLAAGLAWWAFLGALLLAAWRAARTGEAHAVALGAAAAGVLAAALAGAPLSDNPAAASLSCGVFGALLARSGGAASPVRSAAARLLPGALLVLLVLAAPAALALVRHGRALAQLARPEARWSEASVRARARRALHAVDAALAQRADSALAHALHARLLEQADAADGEVLDAWRRVLELRPHRVEALMQSGTIHARRGDAAEARGFYEHALALDPLHPGLLRNLARLELLAGRVEAGLAALERLAEREPVEPYWLAQIGAELVLRGKDREGFALLERAGRARPAAAEELWSRSRDARDGGDALLADALEAQAHREWARRHAEAGRFHDAVRSYRQCLRLTYAFDAEGALRVRMELAAAALCDGDEHEARERLAGARPAPADWAGLPGWAGERLLATGWFGG